MVSNCSPTLAKAETTRWPGFVNCPVHKHCLRGEGVGDIAARKMLVWTRHVSCLKIAGCLVLLSASLYMFIGV